MSVSIAKRPPDAYFKLSTDVWTAPFWEAASRRELTAAQCADCGRFRMPPTPFCPHCRSQRLTWPVLSGRGCVYSYTVVWRAVLPQMEASIPYVPAIIELAGAGGARLISNLVDMPVDSIAVGAEVEVLWDAVNGAMVPRFRAASGPGL